MADKIKIKDREYNEKECYIKSIQINENNSKVWNILGTLLAEGEKVTIGDKD